MTPALSAIPNGPMGYPALAQPLQKNTEGTDAQGARYRVLAALQRGGMGELFLAEHSFEDQSGLAVVKRLLPDLMDDENYVSMFRTEAEVMSHMNHPSIVRVLGLPSLGGSLCLAMEFVRGRNLGEILVQAQKKQVLVPPGLALQIMVPVLRALAYAHAYVLPNGRHLRLVHRDVSPGNILVSFDGAVKLTDFGISKSRMSAVSTTVGIVKGKARYLSPEQILGERATPRSDVFSAASVLCELLTNEPLFDRGTVPRTLYAIVHGERQALTDLLPKDAHWLAEVLQRALTTKADNRLASAGRMADELEDAAAMAGLQQDPGKLAAYVQELFKGEPDPLEEHLPPFEGNPLQARAAIPLNPDSFEDSAPSETLVLSQEHIISEDDERPTNLHPLSDSPIAMIREGSTTASDEEADEETIAAVPHSSPQAAAEFDAALNVLAWLQTQQTPDSSTNEQSPKEIDVEDTPVQAPPQVEIVKGRPLESSAPAPARKSAKSALIFVAGCLCGAAVTGLFFQSQKQEPIAPIAPASAQAKPKTTLIAAAQPQRAAVDEPLPPSKANPFAPPASETTPVEPKKEAEPTAKAAAVPATSKVPSPVPKDRLAPATIDILYPRGARVRLDGKRLPGRVPIRGISLPVGKHRVKIYRGRYRRYLNIQARPGEYWKLTRRLRKAH